MITAPRLYLERYAVIFLSMVVVGIWETFYIFSRSPIDRSMIGFACFGLLVYYFAVHYKPVRLLDRMLANVASQMLQGVFFFDAGGRCVWVNRAGRETFHIDRDNYEPSAELLAGIFGDISGEEWVRHEAIMDGSVRKYYQLDINDFKMVNDVFGREFGDHALKCVADSLRGDLGPECLYGRLSGDTFGMCIPKERFDPEIAIAALSRFTVENTGGVSYLHNEKGQVVGAEALARWVHPTEGLLAPYRFIPTLEKNGMIAWVDRHMWRCACELLTGWKDNDLFISINVSPKDFYFMDVVKELTGLVREYAVEPSRLRVEITETVMMTDEAKRIEILKALREAGFIVEMDDFGSGYSSLNMLKDMPVDVVKIDMAFLRKTQDDVRARTILSSIMQMTNNLKLAQITEGVETAEQFANLRDMGCGMFQGYYFARPMAVEDFMEFLDGSRVPA